MLLFPARISTLLKMLVALQDLRACWPNNNSSSTSKLFCSSCLNFSQPLSNHKDLLLQLHSSSKTSPPSRIPAASNSKSCSMAFTASSSNRRSSKRFSSRSNCWASLIARYRRQVSPNSKRHHSSSNSFSSSLRQPLDNSSSRRLLSLRASDPSPTSLNLALTINSNKLSNSSSNN